MSGPASTRRLILGEISDAHVDAMLAGLHLLSRQHGHTAAIGGARAWLEVTRANAPVMHGRRLPARLFPQLMRIVLTEVQVWRHHHEAEQPEDSAP